MKKYPERYIARLEKMKAKLEENIQTLKENENRLACLRRISDSVAQSLELGQVLANAVDSVVEVMRVDVAWVFLLNEKNQKLDLAIHRGIPDDFAAGINRLKVGEGLSGRVAATGEAIFVEDVSTDPRLTREIVKKYDMRSMLIVPLAAKGRVNGTLCVAMRRERQFKPAEVELLTAIGNQIGVAVENARLYQRQQETAKHLRAMQESLRSQLRQISRAQEEERKRISHELHDESIQELIVLSRKIDTLAASEGLPRSQRQQLEESLKSIENIVRGIRRLSQDLRPAALDRLGLLPALEWLAADVANYSGLNIGVSVAGTPRRLPAETELMLFRIVQEALRNVWRHAGATEAAVRLEFAGDKTKITIADNGKGFELPHRLGALARSGKLGLAGMQERAQLIGGTLTVQSQPGKGTSATVEIPA